jgi:riboflavin synthase
MFTGIITHLGKLKKKKDTRFIFTTDASFFQQVTQGTSINVNGVCVTVVDLPTDDSFSIEVIPETEKKTNITTLKKGDLVNLELPATPKTFLSGHLVQGHVDGVGIIKSISNEENSFLFTISIPKYLSNYLVEKGSIAVNGISLTVIHVAEDCFTVGVIPHTWKKTMLHMTQVHDKVNIEVDVLAKYLEKIVQRSHYA